ncbi:MAG: hypothetical protein KF805_00555 [Phycisphaeraceae bacterium]|nr:hypothetical protein [Phycisphaeraceae bacterium]
MSKLAFVVLTLCSIALGACTGVASPKLSILDVHQDEHEPTGRRIILIVKAENLSDVQLPLRDATYTVRLDGKEVFRGQRSPESTLRKWGVQELRFPVALPTERWPTASGPVRYDISGSLVYLPPGKFNEILYDYGLLRPTASFRGSGEVSLHAPATTASISAESQPGG